MEEPSRAGSRGCLSPRRWSAHFALGLGRRHRDPRRTLVLAVIRLHPVLQALGAAREQAAVSHPGPPQLEVRSREPKARWGPREGSTSVAPETQSPDLQGSLRRANHQHDSASAKGSRRAPAQVQEWQPEFPHTRNPRVVLWRNTTECCKPPERARCRATVRNELILGLGHPWWRKHPECVFTMTTTFTMASAWSWSSRLGDSRPETAHGPLRSPISIRRSSSSPALSQFALASGPTVCLARQRRARSDLTSPSRRCVVLCATRDFARRGASTDTLRQRNAAAHADEDFQTSRDWCRGPG